MPTHNPECTHGGAHGPSECRDRYARHLKPLEDPISAPEATQCLESASELTPADREALRAALAGLEPVAVQNLAGADHDPYRDPDSDADAAQRAGDQF